MTSALVLRAPRLFAGTDQPPVANGAVGLVGTRIVAAGSLDQVVGSLPEPVQVVDYPDCTLLPGLIDSHTHLLFSAGDQALDDALHDSDEIMLLRGVANAQAELRCGVTTVRDCGGRGLLTLRLREAVRQGIVVGPRILAAGMPITTTGGHLHFCGLEADGLLEVVKAVRRLCKAGVDFIKVMATGGGMTPGTNPRAPQYTQEELTALVAEARRLGRQVAAHCHATEGIARAVLAGVQTIEHCSWLHPEAGHLFDERVARAMRERGTVVTLTMGSERAVLKPPEDLAPWQREAVARYGPHFDVLRRTIQAGVPFIAASDAGVSRTFFDEYFLTLEVLVFRLEVPPLEALRATTGRAARVLGLAGQTGTLEPGCAGDLVVVAGDPCSDIRALRQVVAVYRDGRLVVDRGRLVPPPRSPAQAGVSVERRE